MNILLSVLPSFQSSNFLIPHLGLASLSAYLKENLENNYEINTLDLRLDSHINNIWSPRYLPEITKKTQYVSDIYELPIIIELLSKFISKQSIKNILNSEYYSIEEWSLDRFLDPLKVKDTLKKTSFWCFDKLRLFANQNIVGFSLYTTNLYLSILMATFIKKKYPKTKIVFGGPQVTQSDSTKNLLLDSDLADFLVIGEGENSLLEIVNHLSGKDINNFSGIMTKEKKDISFGKKIDLNILPLPNYKSINFKNYNPSVIPVYSNRGCPFRCHFCSEHSLFGNKFKVNKAKKTINDIKKMIEIYKLSEFTLSDSLINSSEGWLEDFTDLLLKEKLDISWGGYFRAELNEKLVKKMKKTGLRTAILGVESFSQETLNNMNKKKYKDKIIDSLRYLVNSNIYTFTNLFVGYPGETDFDFNNTIEGSKKLYKEFDKVGKKEYFKIHTRTFQVRPFSAVYNNLDKFGIFQKNWSNYISESYNSKQFTDILKKTLCTFSVKDIPIEKVIERLYLMKNIK